MYKTSPNKSSIISKSTSTTKTPTTVPSKSTQSSTKTNLTSTLRNPITKPSKISSTLTKLQNKKEPSKTKEIIIPVTENTIPTKPLPVVLNNIIKKKKFTFKPLSQLYVPQKWKKALVHRIYMRSFCDIEQRVQRKCYKFLGKYLGNIYCDLGKPDKRAIARSGIHYYKKDPKIFSGMIKRVEFDILQAEGTKQIFNSSFYFLKRLKNVTSCSVTINTVWNNMEKYSLAKKLVKRWRKIRFFQLGDSGEWTNKHWRYLRYFLRHPIKGLSLNIRTPYDQMIDPEFLKCAKRLKECEISSLNLTLQIKIEQTLERIFEECGYFQHLRSLTLKCSLNNDNKSLYEDQYQLSGIVENILPKLFQYTKRIQQLHLDLSNDDDYYDNYMMGDSEIKSLCTGISGLLDLKDLKINLSNIEQKSISIGDKSMEAFRELINELKDLEKFSVDLDNTNVTPKGIERVLESVMMKEKFRYLRFSVTKNGFQPRVFENILANFKKTSHAECLIRYEYM